MPRRLLPTTVVLYRPQQHMSIETSTQPSQIRLLKLRGEEFPKVYTNNREHEKIGRLILPDVVALEGAGMDYAKKYGHAESLTAVNSKEKRPKDHRRKNGHHKSKASIEKTMVFGLPIPEEPLPEHVKYLNRMPLIRYSVLNRNLPLVVEKPRSDSHQDSRYEDSEEYDDDSEVMYLTEADPLCYCDELCIRYGDCCSDYTYVCPPLDCHVSEWSSWSECFTERGHRCGCGKQERRRKILQEPAYGGKRCPSLVETKACFRECPKKEAADITTVALLLDYKYHDARKVKHRNTTYIDPPEIVEKKKTLINYCVKYELGWVNRNCVDKRFITSLFTGNTICAECQPEAQLHRRTPRCASDLDDGMKGFWKLIGPLSCNGIWKRISRIDNCRCSEHLPNLPPYLMV
uniref:SMB domain-containing protein n=1 Tax=Acrobeloides nanus TaxID=290746 RepID=A0A914BZJ1_9BILA